MTNFLKKSFTVSVVVATIFWAVGVAAFLPVGVSAASEGDLIKMDGNSSVYYYAGGKRNVFPSESVYFSWYSDFSGVKTISAAELQALPLGTNIMIRPGTKLVKITTDPKVYAVGPDGTLHHVDSEARATTLFGANWASRVVDVADSFFTNYTVGSALSSNVHPEGALIKYASSGDIYRISADGTKQKFASMDAFNANRFKLSDVITVSDTLTYPNGADITGGMTAYTDASQGMLSATAGGNGGALTIALASDSPAATNIPSGTSVVFAKYNLSASSKDVSLTSLKLTSAGLGDSTAIDNVTMYAGSTKVSTSKNVNSDREATFSFATPLVVEAGTTKVITVKATIGDGADALTVNDEGFFALGVKTAGDVTSNASSVSGSFPVNGATMNASGSVAVGELVFADGNDTSTAKVGDDNVSLVEFTAQASTTEDVNFKGITLRNNGNVRGADMGTLTLYHDGVAVATATMDSDKYVSFGFDSILIKKGETEDFEVKGDINGGNASDTIQLYIKDDSDVDAIGAGYGFQVTVDQTTNWAATSSTVTLAAGQMVINWDGTAVPAGDIMIDADNVVLGKATIKAASEAVKISSLYFTVNGAEAAEFENPELVDVDTGGIIDLEVASTADMTPSTTEEISIAKGATKAFWFRFDTTSTSDADDVYTVTLATAGITAEGETSGTTITDITPSSVTSKNQTVVASALTHVTKTLSAVNSIAGATDVPVYKGTLRATSASDIKVTKIVFRDASAANDTYFADDDVTEAKLVINDSIVATKSNEIAEGTGDNTLTFNGLSYTVKKGTEVTFYLKLSFAGTKSGDTAFNINLDDGDITAKDVNNDSVNPSEDTTAGPTVTLYSTGVLDISGSNTESGANRALHVVGGKASGLVSAYKFDAKYEGVKVKDFAIYIANDSGTDADDDIARVELVDSDKTTVLATSTQMTWATIDGSGTLNDLRVLFEDWNYVIPEAGVKTIFVRVVTKEIGDGGEQTGTAGTSLSFLINGAAITAEGNDSGDTITVSSVASVTNSNNTSEYDNDFATNAVTNYGVTVTGITNDLANGFLTNGQSVVGKFKFTVDSGNNTDSAGNAAEFNFEDVVFTFGYVDDALIVGDGGAGADFYYYWASDPSDKVTVSDYADNDDSDDVDLSGLPSITGTDTLIVEVVTLTGAGDAGDYLQIKLASIGGADFEWNDGTTTGFTGLALPYTSVSGGTLSN